MILTKEATYNPKIDYLICRNLVKCLPWKYNEFKLRQVYDGTREPTRKFAKDLVAIKNFFSLHNLTQFSIEEISNLYCIITGEKISIDQIELAGIKSVDDLFTIVKSIEKINVGDRDVLFRVILLVRCSINQDTPLIPYVGVCRKLYWHLIIGDEKQVKFYYHYLLSKTAKYSHKHDIALNNLAVKQLISNKDEFIKNFKIKQLGVYGSLAIGKGNEYSDLDIMVILPNETPASSTYLAIRKFWAERIDIPIDITVLQEKDMATKTTEAMQKSLKLL